MNRLTALAMVPLLVLACSSPSGGDATPASTGGTAGASGAGAGGSDAAGAGGAAGTGGSGPVGGSGATGGTAAGGGATGSSHVVFRYRPSWAGVTQVTVLGGFGMASDWMPSAPLAKLADDGTGTFTGSAELPNGQYLYVFHVVGDAQAAAPATSARYVVDPGNADVAVCPMASPTFTTAAPNPCSQLTVPQPAAAATHHAKAMITAGGQPAAGYLVVLEREESMQHHFFVDRATLGPDGAFDMTAAPGHYRVQVQHPTLMTVTDAKRDPVKLGALRRAISAAFDLSADVTITVPDMAYSEYGAFAPTGAQTLPTHFTFGKNGGAPTHLDVYSASAAGDIGDPWFASPTAVTTGAADFTGSFDTKQAMDPMAKPGVTYWWGTEQSSTLGGVTWTLQSMVFPITWK